ncbi:unnamed protein product, partial [Didymodactylos carnosus]
MLTKGPAYVQPNPKMALRICKVRSKYFPFDRQICTIIFRSGAHDKLSIKFYQRRLIQRHQFIHGEWDLEASYTDVFEQPISEHMSNFNTRCVPVLLRLVVLEYLAPIVYCDCSKLKRSIRKPKHRTTTKTSLIELCSIEQCVSRLLASWQSDDTTTVRTTTNTNSLSPSLFNEQGVELLKCLRLIKTHLKNCWMNTRTTSGHELNGTSMTNAMKNRLHEWQQIALVLDRLFFLLFIISMPCTCLLFLSTRFASNGIDYTLKYSASRIEDAKCNM